MNKSAFIRANLHLSNKALLERAKKAGLNLSLAYIYSIRTAAKAAEKKKTPAATHASAPSSPDTAQRLRDIDEMINSLRIARALVEKGVL